MPSVRNFIRVLAVACALSAGLFLNACGGSDCPAGNQGCACTPSDTCRGSTLSCIEGLCRSCENGSCVPLAPKCYSPCRESFVDGAGNLRTCSSEGLMDGCLAGSTCDRGTCIPTAGGVRQTALMSVAQTTADGGVPQADGGVSPPPMTDLPDPKHPPGACARPVDCPKHQTCINARCYSTCERSDECESGSICYSKVCRPICGAGNPCRGSNQVCQQYGNSQSVCMPQVEASGKNTNAAAPAPADFVLLAPANECPGGGECPIATLEFNTQRQERQFVLANRSTQARKFQLRKASQQTFDDDGNLVVFRASDGENPIPWVEMGAGTAVRAATVELTVPARGQTTIIVKGVRNTTVPRWQAQLEVVSPGLNTRTLGLAYNERVAGRWSGQVYYFGNFGDRTRGRTQLDDWMANKNNEALANQIPNAFMRTWARFRGGRVSLSEMRAVMESILTGSWSFHRVQELCRQSYASAICAPIAGASNQPVIPITQDPETTPVPSGVVELGIALNLGAATTAGACGGNPNCFTGRIDSSVAMQYHGNPAIALGFEGDPAACAAGNPTSCLAFLNHMSSTITVGARYSAAPGSAVCGTGFEAKDMPWLVPGFMRTSTGTMLTNYTECRDNVLPFVGNPRANVGFAPANPIPDGRSRKRTLELIDGIMIEQRVMMLIFRERTESFLGQGGVFSGYGYMVLQREGTDPAPAEINGTAPPAMIQNANRSIEPTCPESVIDRVFPTGGFARLEDVTQQAQRDLLANVVVDGRPVPAAQLTAINPNVEQAHYLCTWTELGGALSAGQTSSNGQTVASGSASGTANTIGRAIFDGHCPSYARILYFTLRQGGSAPAFTSTCNTNNSCDTVLREWANQGVVRMAPTERPNFPAADANIFNLTWACQDPAVVFCDDYRNLLSGKRFFAETEGQAVFNALRTEIKESFRYKTQFQSRSGQNVGFAPVVCDSSSRLVPYCYAPGAILDTRDRVDCALAIYDRHVSGTAPLNEAVATALRDYLRENFGFSQLPNPLGDPRIEDGFERLNAELLVMLGDDAYTASFMSRFDLAGSRLSGFEGSRFEEGGIDLAGVAGYEMYKLYQAAQYFQMVLDRFFAQTPLLWRNLEQADQNLRGFITNKTVAGYLTRVIRASTQLSNTWNEIARRYQAMNRPDLARKVIERSYARAYMEAQILAEFMRRIEEVVPGNQQDQVTVAVQEAQRRYRVAMLDMYSAFQRISDDVTVFGFARDYIPFPALAESDLNAFAVIMARANQRVAVAAEDELRALADNRSYETNAAAFQSELVQIRSNYEKQLGELCGSFQGSDGRIYPAVPRYAHLDRRLSTLYDPCGFSSGDIWRKAGDLANLEISLRRLRQEVTNLKSQAQDLIAKVQTQCDITRRTADFRRAMQTRINDLQTHVDRMEKASENLGRVLDFMGNASSLAQSTVDSNPFLVAGKVSVLTAYLVAGTAVLISQAVLDIAINELKDDIRDLELDRDYYVALAECEQFVAEGVYEFKQIQREVLLKNMDVLIALNDIDTAISDLSQLNNERLRLEAEWEDSNQLTINVEAARNDPNVRIYKNDAIINADRSFTAAVREAYRATKVYEYYTGQSYAAQEKLFLTRMVTAGDYNLKQYLVELEDAFYDFGEEFGNPATRVAVISLRDDVFQVPHYDERNKNAPRQLTQGERVARFRQLLMNDQLVDNDGNIVVPFSTNFDEVSPLTNNHKILFIEAAVHGEDTGDDVARLYLRQVGSSAVRNARGDRRYYAFPPRTAVLNPFFSGENRAGRAAFDTFLGGPTLSIFRDYRFRDRPFVHSNWEFVFNPRTEQVNKDVNLNSLDDILLYVYYTDFVNL